ncbi:LysR family transcriptional regulator [Oerskovia flava]|uniref:LysR family transcriptional regulator n=1 Tax=Oerskovia flava TaxID=2986422 RepID=UPI00223F9779|nr:LysR family transcriptional regulator [Oerskovia sp. JB1-3-2]
MAQPSRTARAPLGLLEVLVATDSHGSISAAARSLGLTQPSASAGLRRLERHLGLELVTRTPRGAVLTETGRATATWAREVIEASDRLETSAAALREAPDERVRLAASLTIAEYLAPRWLATLALSGPQHRAPDVELLVRNSQAVMDLVLAGDAELGFVESSSLRRGLRSRTLAHDELVAVVGPAHPWATRRRRSVTVDELVASDLVVRESGSGTREILEKALLTAGTALPGHLAHLGSTAALKTAVQYAGAVSVLSRLTVADDLARGTLVAVPVPGLDLARRLRMVWKDGTDLSAAARRIAAVATSSAGQAGQPTG